MRFPRSPRAQDKPEPAAAPEPKAEQPATGDAAPDSPDDKLLAGLKFKTGNITISNGLAVLHLPDGWQYLESGDAKKVIVDIWGNPPAAAFRALGMVIPANQDLTAEESWAIVVSWQEDGYVPDSDADEINYDELLKQLKEQSTAASAQREKQGYGKLLLTGWALPPRYDKSAKVLHWAKAFDSGLPVQSLNYDVRVLGRRGVLSMNAIASMNQIKEIESAAPSIVKLVEFNPGHRYADYVEGKDKKSDYSLTGLVVGGAVAAKLLAKGGLLVLLAKFGKILIIPFVFLIAWLKKRFSRNS